MKKFLLSPLRAIFTFMMLFVCSLVWASTLVTKDQTIVTAFQRGGTVLNFDSISPNGGGGSNGNTGTPIQLDSQLTDQFASEGVIFSSTAGAVGVVSVEGLSNETDATSPFNLIGGSSAGTTLPELDYFQPITLQFVLPNTTTPAVTSSVGAWNDPTGSRILLSVFDLNGDLLESVQADEGFFIGITNTSIASATFSFISTQSESGFSLDDVTIGSDSIGFADIVVEFFDSGAGSISCPEGQGGVFPPPAASANCVPLSVVLGNDSGTTSNYLSLPVGSFITVGFIDDEIIDGPGDDIFISEVGNALEHAEIFVSTLHSTNPSDFTFIGIANGNTISSFDLASIGFTDQVRAVKIISLNNGGFPTAPGFDLAHVKAINFVPVDSDRDGIPDYLDNFPHSEADPDCNEDEFGDIEISNRVFLGVHTCHAMNDIKTGFGITITNGAIVTFDAGASTFLHSGFHAENGSHFSVGRK